MKKRKDDESKDEDFLYPPADENSREGPLTYVRVKEVRVKKGGQIYTYNNKQLRIGMENVNTNRPGTHTNHYRAIEEGNNKKRFPNKFIPSIHAWGSDQLQGKLRSQRNKKQGS